MTGGDGKIGTVISVNDYGTCGHERDAITVTWPANKDGNRYRLGYRGKVDVRCVEESPGLDYYKDHLLTLGKGINNRECVQKKTNMLSKMQEHILIFKKHIKFKT